MRSGLLLVTVTTLAGCSGPATLPTDRPKILRYAFNPTADDIQTSNKRYQQLVDFLGKKLNLPVSMVQAAGYSATIEAMRANKIDAGTMGPLSYLIGSQRAGLKALVLPGRADGPSTYQSCIIVRADSPIRSLAELVRDSRKYTFAFVDPASTSGHLVPRVFLQSQGIDPERDFRKMFFSTNHPTTLYTVTGGKVDAGATMASMIRTMEENGKLKRGEVRILWESEPIPGSPVVVRKELPDSFKEELRKAFLALHVEAPELAAELQVTSKYPDFRYHPASDQMYDGLRAIAKDLKNVKILE
jgi:phosphonate transport system substrate-binding protein